MTMTNTKISKKEINEAINRLRFDRSLEAHLYGDVAWYGIGYNVRPNGSVQFVVFDGMRKGGKASATIEYKNGKFGEWQRVA